MEECDEKLRIVNENLTKKVEFFKEQTMNKTNQTQESIKKDKEIKKLTEEILKKTKQNFTLKQLISKISDKLRTRKETKEVEIAQIKNQLKFFKKSIKGIFEMMVIRLKDEVKQSSYYKREFKRLNKDVNYLERINKEFVRENLINSTINNSSSFIHQISEEQHSELSLRDNLAKPQNFKKSNNSVFVPKIPISSIPTLSYTNSNVEKIRLSPKKISEVEDVHSESFNDDAANFYLSNSVISKHEKPQFNDSILQSFPGSGLTTKRNLEDPKENFATKNQDQNYKGKNFDRRKNYGQIEDASYPRENRNIRQKGYSDQTVEPHHQVTKSTDKWGLGLEFNKIEQESLEIERRIEQLKKRGGEMSYTGYKKTSTAGYKEALNSARERVKEMEKTREDLEIGKKMNKWKIRENEGKFAETKVRVAEKSMIGMIVDSDKENFVGLENTEVESSKASLLDERDLFKVTNTPGKLRQDERVAYLG